METGKKGLRYGIIGPGRIARKFCEAVKKVDGVEVAAVASRTEERARAFAEEYGVEACGSYEELVARRDIDAIYIATTHNFHFENLLLSLNAGKHVICEKAMVLTKAQAEQVFALAKEKNCFCMEGMWSRFLPPIQKAKEWISSGRLGTVEMANCVVGFRADPDPESRLWNPGLAGGAMYDMGVYAIEITDYLIPEEVRKVTSVITRMDHGVDKMDNITLAYGNCVANLQIILTSNTDSALDIYGTEGRIHIPSPVTCESCELYDSKGLLERFYSRNDNGFEYEIQEMADCIRAGKLENGVVPHRDTILCASIFEQCLETK